MRNQNLPRSACRGIFLGLLAYLSAAAPSLRAETQYFDFTGACTSGCTGEATAVLTLQNYTLGTNVTVGDFVEFSFTSNDPGYDFDITASSLLDLDAGTNLTIPTLGTGTVSLLPLTLLSGPQPAGVYITGSASPFEYYFESGTDESWSESDLYLGDPAGDDGIWTYAPEPSSILLFGAGLLGIAAKVRRRARN